MSNINYQFDYSEEHLRTLSREELLEVALELCEKISKDIDTICGDTSE